tara:strand:+ start:233 stop:1228 length:996 start_codon:yes stop_codon:yes gene_type:complete
LRYLHLNDHKSLADNDLEVGMKETTDQGEKVFGITTADPAKGAKTGTAISFKNVRGWNSDATEVPTGLSNWHAFEGALLAVMLKSGEEMSVLGTAVMIAPGLAVSATHVFDQHFGEMANGEVVPYCFGIRQEGLSIWNVRQISANENDDICLLSLEANSAFPEDMTYYKFGVSTRALLANETVHIVGFRNAETVVEPDRVMFHGNFHAAQGRVVGTYPEGLPGRFMPYPLIEINCGSLGGMSGGAVIDRRGLVLGVISRGLETKDQRGPTYANWILSAMSREVTLGWPSGLHKESQIVCNMRPEFMFIDNRDALDGTTKDKLRYRIWMNTE